MFERILLSLDGSAIAEQAMPLVQMLAARLHSSIILFRAVEPVYERVRVNGEILSTEDQLGLLTETASGYLNTIQKDFESAGLRADCQVQVGVPATAILKAADAAAVDLITMATHGRTGLQRWALGSVASKVVTAARRPVLLVRASETPTPPAPITRVLVPLDGSPLAERALVPARQLATAFDAELFLFRAWQHSAYMVDGFPSGMSVVALDEAVSKTMQDYLAQTAEELKKQGARVSWELHCGPVADCILDAAEKGGASLISMSTHGRSGVGRWVMGSVADRVVSATRVPVLLIRATNAS